MQEFRGERMMGHEFQRCGCNIKVKWKWIGKKNMHISGLLFFLSILEAGASVVAVAIRTDLIKKKIII